MKIYKILINGAVDTLCTDCGDAIDNFYKIYRIKKATKFSGSLELVEKGNPCPVKFYMLEAGALL